MDTQKIESFNIIGIEVRTSNENGQAAKDIPALWNTFMTEGILHRIPNKVDDTIYCVYCDYEKDHTRPYTTLLGCIVSTLDSIPHGLTGKCLPSGNYTKQIAKGNLLQGAVFAEWTKIWNANIPRIYTADFEVYGERAQDPTHAEVDIFLAVE